MLTKTIENLKVPPAPAPKIQKIQAVLGAVEQAKDLATRLGHDGPTTAPSASTLHRRDGPGSGHMWRDYIDHSALPPPQRMVFDTAGRQLSTYRGALRHGDAPPPENNVFIESWSLDGIDRKMASFTKAVIVPRMASQRLSTPGLTFMPGAHEHDGEMSIPAPLPPNVLGKSEVAKLSVAAKASGVSLSKVCTPAKVDTALSTILAKGRALRLLA